MRFADLKYSDDEGDREEKGSSSSKDDEDDDVRSTQPHIQQGNQ